MSQSAAVRTARAPRPLPRHQGQQGRQLRQVAPPPPSPRLRVVSAARHTRSRAGLVVVCVALLVLGLVGLLLLDVSLERGAYDLQAQNQRAEVLREQAQQLRGEIVTQEAPQNLEKNARAQGMVYSPGAPVFVKPGGGTIGVPQRAVADPSPSVKTPTASPTAKAPATAGKATAGKAGGGKAAAGAATKRTTTTRPTPTAPGH